jgi:hypothetical protein
MISKRERYLMVLIIAIGGSYGLFLVVRGLFLGPLEAQASQVRALTSEIASKQKQMEDIFNASSRLAEWEKLSLPGDEGVAQALYQDYLFKLMRVCHFEDPQVSADQLQKNKAFTSVPFTIRGRVSLENLTEFLYRFHAFEPKVMHQVRSLTIGQPDNKSKNLSVTIIVAAIALDGAPKRASLVPDGEDLGQATIEDIPLEKFALISKKNIFEPFREPAPPRERDTGPQVDAPRFVVYSGCTQSGREPEGWIYDRLNNVNTFVRAGDDLAIAGLKAKVVSVAASNIVLHMDDKEWTLKLGKNLRELKESGRPVAKSDNSEASPPIEPEKVPQTSPPDPSVTEPEKTSDEKADKIGMTFPVKKELVGSEYEVTKADGGS